MSQGGRVKRLLEISRGPTVLIPAAGRVPEGLLSLSNISCPAMIPVAGRPVVHWTLGYLRELGLKRFRVGVARRGLFVEEFVESAFGADCRIDFVVPRRDGGLGFTVLELLEGVESGPVLVVLGDTHFRLDDVAILASDEPFVLTHPVEESYRWCLAEADGAGHLTRLRDKEAGLAGDLQALVGVYYFPDAGVARRAAAENVAEAERSGRRAEMAGLLERVARESPIRIAGVREWLDCGNPDRQAASHRALLQARAFNELTIDPVLGTITKRSRQREKFLQEIDYLRLLPPEIAVLFPRLLDFSTAWNEPWMTMEYYGYPALAEVFLFENLDPGVWQRIFEHLFEIQRTAFRARPWPLPAGTVRQMYLEKTRRRVDQLDPASPVGAFLRRDGVLAVNGRSIGRLEQLWERLAVEIDRLEANAQGAIVHGDLCLSNILYDVRSRICKLIDPRGSFGREGIYGDPRYDVAKLYHSVYGLYDFIVNDLFRVEVNGGDLLLTLRTTPQHREIEQRFSRVFFGEFDRREIVLIAGLLFVSMPALHSERPDRQLAMLARGMQLLDEALGGLA